MLGHLADVHWIGVVVATTAFGALGGIYFAVLFPKQYAYAIGRENQSNDERAGGALFYAGPLVCALVVVVADALFISALGIGTVGGAIVFGLVTGVGFLVPMAFNIAINPLFPRPLVYGLLNAPYFVIGNVVASVLVVVIPW
ncbi:DUF1761 domain-containing protein [Mycobacterium deserti]|uniref:DUF1761 family protein n=1 Tax=Mycobacterium deserti TaxID=2978347 RepID=A0ABT2MEL5_9MYCO|nr:DUF1761 domain-containing protein [Mycobacterium deserti]MCT7660719.1 DUF1761 family protein [Mycobacterium deserti]